MHFQEHAVKRQFMSIFYPPGADVWNSKRENYNRSQITKIVGHSSYARMTTRNINTARKLAALCAGPNGGAAAQQAPRALS